ncbi:hypothetical protein P8S55_07345 [Halomonas sp. M1]|uniref:hypothetical protein n=1 Tax=Halomonas sp. M1 TaxID=3035470 RepID=UPI002485E849|nr:hypothetical protein [Halomonas sp. M1]WFE72906.1 hypothetical protein P8S55_07345 [Halomonas sp. M1]
MNTEFSAASAHPDKDDPKKDQRDDHHDDANPMPDTHHVNPGSKDDDSSDKKDRK